MFQNLRRWLWFSFGSAQRLLGKSQELWHAPTCFSLLNLQAQDAKVWAWMWKHFSTERPDTPLRGCFFYQITHLLHQRVVSLWGLLSPSKVESEQVIHFRLFFVFWTVSATNLILRLYYKATRNNLLLGIVIKMSKQKWKGD